MKYIRTSVELTRDNFIFYRKLAYGDKKRLLNATLKNLKHLTDKDNSVVGKIISGKGRLIYEDTESRANF